ncbi:uncharacterized protein [Elaeis guineensis]|uniref:Uncharacterized protein LOC105050373 n=1 Tax=Elaeis guineensis var. tenera TaxID=51953 RepID=A0A6I9RM72_ELAGV|nr:uncharacterized protein LOC105050373 [Elaeis guineensis]
MKSPHISRARDSPPETDHFKFFYDPCSPAEMCAADDVFFQGKLLPFGSPPAPAPKKDKIYNPRSQPREQRWPETVDGFNRPRGLWGGANTPEYQRLRKAPESDAKVLPPRSRPRWYLCVIGTVRLPAAMEMRDIRSRQRRRSTPVSEAAEHSGRWSFEGSKSWKLLRSLSCKGVESAVAAAPLRLVSHV